MVSNLETNPADIDVPALHQLLQDAFAYMTDRIDPPSSLSRMTQDDIAAKTLTEDLFVVREGDLPVACLFGSEQGAVYYIGKLAVAQTHRGKKLASALVNSAALHAQSRGYMALELESRVELVENHAVFVRLGFEKVGETAHPGYTRPTSYTFRRPLSSPQGVSGL